MIAPDLCVNILLGLPFLKHNKIVIDHDSDTVIDKSSGFDLLNHNNLKITQKPPRNILSPKQKRLSILYTKRQVLQELKYHCSERLKLLEDTNSFESIANPNFIASIKSTILRLATKQELLEKESKLKSEFERVFSPIPHVDLFPPHEPARIHLKDAYKKIATRSYSCPQQYKEAFRILIKQRLDSGFIRPSSSSFASPSFIVPKKDPKVLP